MKIVKKTTVRHGQELPCAKSNILDSEPNETNKELNVWYIDTVEGPEIDD